MSAIYLPKGWNDFDQACTEKDKNWLDCGEIYSLFKVTGGQRMLQKALSVIYLFKEFVDFNQTCTDTLLGDEKELIRFWLPRPHFQSHRMSTVY